MIILEKHPVSGYEPRHYRREPDDVLTHTEQRRQRITFGAATVAVAMSAGVAGNASACLCECLGLAASGARPPRYGVCASPLLALLGPVAARVQSRPVFPHFHVPHRGG